MRGQADGHDMAAAWRSMAGSFEALGFVRSGIQEHGFGAGIVCVAQVSYLVSSYPLTNDKAQDWP